MKIQDNYRKNFISLLSGQTVFFIINFFSILLAARFLGVENFGDFANLLAIITVLSKLIDFGMGPILFRELAKNQKNENVFSNAISVKLIIAIAVLILMNFFFFLSSFSKLEILLANLLFLTVFISSRMANFREILVTPFKASMRMQLPMILNVMDSVLLLIGVILIPILKQGIIYFTFIYVLSNLPGFVILLIQIKKKFNYHIKLLFENSRWLIKESAPLAGFVLLMVLYQQVDIILLKYMKGSFDAGIFAAAARLTVPLNIIPTTFVTVIFPYIVKKSENSENKSTVIKLIFKSLFFISITIALISSFKINDFTVLIFGEDYSAAVVPALFLFWAQTFLFFNFFSLDLLTAHGKQKWNFIYAFLILVINLLIDIILIPTYGYDGVGFAKIIAAIFGIIFISNVLTRIKIGFNFFQLNTFLWLTGVAVSVYILSLFSLIIYVPFSIIVILTLTYYLNFFNKKELVLILKFLNRENWIHRLIRN